MGNASSQQAHQKQLATQQAQLAQQQQDDCEKKKQLATEQWVSRWGLARQQQADCEEKQKEVNLIIKRDALMDDNHILIKVPPEGGEVIIINERGARGTILDLLERKVQKIVCAPEDPRTPGIRTFTVHSHDGIKTKNVTNQRKGDTDTVTTMELAHPSTTQYIKLSYFQLDFSDGNGLLFKLAPHVGDNNHTRRTTIEMKPKIAAGGSLALLRQDILRTELQLGKRDIAARRTYNAKVGKVHQLT